MNDFFPFTYPYARTHKANFKPFYLLEEILLQLKNKSNFGLSFTKARQNCKDILELKLKVSRMVTGAYEYESDMKIGGYIISRLGSQDSKF